MPLQHRILGLLLGAFLCLSFSCVDTEPGAHVRRDGPIPGITPGVDGPDEVEKTLGRPSSKANGWWEDEHRFEMDYRVWYYKGVGRVIFSRYSAKVHATEADQDQGGLPN